MAEKSQNIRFNPERYLDRANYVLKQIKDALDDPHTKYDIKPSSDRSYAFESITGTMTDGNMFKVEHITPKVRKEQEKLYVMYCNVEFESEWPGAGFKINIVSLIDSFINSEYVYDENSNRYVNLPRELSFTDKLDNWLSARKARKQKSGGKTR